MLKKELNIKQSERLKRCLSKKNMTQSELAKRSGYTQQYISNLSVGKKNFTLESARTIGKILCVREEYLLCEDDYETENEIEDIWLNKFSEKKTLLLRLLQLAGYEPICDFVENWQQLELDKTIYGPFLPNDCAYHHIPLNLEDKIKCSTEIISPNGKTFYCDIEDFQLLEYELIEYIRLRMKFLESKYAWKFDEARINPRSYGSEISFYNHPDNTGEYYFDLLEDSGIWTNHESDVFPDANIYLKKK